STSVNNWDSAAIYARFSTDPQNERSVEDQIALCRDYAARHQLTVWSPRSRIRPSLRRPRTDNVAGPFDRPWPCSPLQKSLNLCVWATSEKGQHRLVEPSRMNPEEYSPHAAVGLADLVRRGEVSAAEVCDAAIARIKALNPALNAVISRRFDQACAE